MSAIEPTADPTLRSVDAAKRALAQMETVEEVSEMVDWAEVARTYARKAKLGLEAQNHAAQIKLLAERRAGALLAEQNGLGSHGGDRRSNRTVRLEDLGINSDQSSRWQRIAELPEETFESYVSETREREEELTSAGALRLAKKLRKEKERGQAASDEPPEPPDPPDGQFSTIVADPPWRYANTSTRGAAEDHYPTMSIDELCNLDVPQSRAADNAHLYLWTTASHLPEAFTVLEAWGFEYKTYLAWVKPQMGMGNYFRVSSELVLFGMKGRLPTQSNSLMNWFEAPRGKHSRKPRQFLSLVMQASPGPYLELFARCRQDTELVCNCSRCAYGWEQWGDEAS